VHENLLLALVVGTALAFDFTNGFHDTANAMATSIATGALKPRVAVALSAVLNLTGAFLSLSVAATIAKGIVQPNFVTLPVVFAGLAGAIIWNVVTWYLGIPSSSSHALIGGVVGAILVHAGTSAVIWNGVLSKVLLPAVLAPLVAGLVAALATLCAFRLTRSVADGPKRRGFRWAQVGSASMVSLAHGTNDAQKTMGIITLALIANGTLAKGGSTPTWAIAACGTAISLGTYLGGWRIIRTLGKGLTDIDTPQGFAAETSSAVVILASTHFGFPLSTTQVCTGSVVGVGIGHHVPVRWRVFGRMCVAWLFTFPAAAVMGAIAFGLQNWIGGNAGIVILALVLIGVCAGIYLLSRREPISPDNVNDEWEAEKPADPMAA
jgi:PiT family inorganic phosphate transporter